MSEQVNWDEKLKEAEARLKLAEAENLEQEVRKKRLDNDRIEALNAIINELEIKKMLSDYEHHRKMQHMAERKEASLVTKFEAENHSVVISTKAVGIVLAGLGVIVTAIIAIVEKVKALFNI